MSRLPSISFARLLPCAVLLSALVLPACNAPPSVFECNPACPAGTRCTESGCVSDRAAADLGIAGADLAAGCAPACGGATPVCRNGACVACTVDGDCPAGQLCRALGQVTACVPGCADDARCGGGAMRCCGGACVDTSRDPGNCGACDARCMVDHASSSCAGGQCARGACAAGWADCNGEANDGCETNVNADTANCLGCGMACAFPHALAGCARGCYVRACEFGWDDCNGNENDGCEANVLGDIRNCGACGATCPNAPRARVACVNAACQLTGCDAGFADCDGAPNNGCEVSTGTDVANCGACGNRCAQGLVCVQGGCTCPNCNLPNARSVCMNFQCVVGMCNAGYGDCDGLPQNGCERALGADVNNCGSCGVKCAQGLVCTNGGCTCPQCNIPGASSKCVNNMCLFDRCLQDFGDCDNNVANGCETSLLTDPVHCGGCGKRCAMGEVCLGGACSHAVCQKGMRKDISPGGDMVVCDDPNDAICEQDMESLCPANWQLCTYKQHANRRMNWNYPVNLANKIVLVGEISCRGRGGGGGAGHFTIPDSNGQPNNAGSAVVFNCYYGSSRPNCVTGYGCNEQYASALCCAPTATCGNGKVDSPEEDCDDGNQDENDTCLNNCAWRVPVDQGLAGTNC